MKTTDFIPNASLFNAEVTKALDEAIEKSVTEHNIAIENLTIEQVVIVFKQAIASGDIRRVVRTGTPHVQSVIYIPFAERERLLNKILQLEAKLTLHGLTLEPEP